MPKTVELNQKSRRLYNLKTYQSLKGMLSVKGQTFRDNELHVFGTTSLSRLVDKNYGMRTISIDGIMQKLFPKFRSAKTEIYFQSSLRKEILSGEYRHKNYLLNRLSDIVRTFTLFAELNVKNLTFQTSNSRKLEIINLLNLLLKEEILKNYLERKNELTKEDISFTLCGHPHIKMICFYEIEYMNFFRMNLIHWLKEKGFQIELYIPYKEQFSRSYAFWKDVYEVVAQADITQCESNLDKLNDVNYGQKFGLFKQNQSNIEVNDRVDVDVIEFNSPTDFVHYYKNHKEHLLAISPKDINRIVQHTNSSIYEDNLGKFIYYIKNCKIENGQIFLEYDILIELITSEWIKTSNLDGNNALSLLIDLRDYMYGVKTTSEVIDRLKSLQQLDLVSKTFDKENSADTDRNHLKRYMLNPFRSFNFIHTDRYSVTINQLIELVERLEITLRYLILEDGKTLNVNDYFARWLNTLENVPKSERKQLWVTVFEEAVPDEWSFANEELLALIYLLASNKSNEQTTIYDISRLQEIILSNKHTQKLHLTNITQLNFPEKHKTTITDLFTYNELKEILNESTDKQQRATALHSLWVDYMVVENFSELGSYQLYNMLAYYEGLMVFSWIKHLKDEDMRSVYLDILEDLYSKQGIKKYERKDLFISVKRKSEHTEPIKIEDDKIRGKIPDLYWLNHDFCSKKFFLTTFIEKQPIYSSEFHQQFIFSKIGKLFSLSHEERQEFRDLIYPLFPHWTYAKKENLIDMEYKIQLKNYKHFENITYPKEMRGFQILRSIYRENRRTKARNQYRKNKNSHETSLIKSFRENIKPYHVIAEPGNHCKMCPFLENCSEGVYSIDHLS